MTEEEIKHFENIAVVHRDRHVIVGKIDIGKVCKNRFTDGEWYAYAPGGERVIPDDCSFLGFRTRREAVRALIVAAEDVLAKEQPIEI